MNDIDRYGEFTQEMWMSKNDERGLTIMSLGLGGEAGEVQEHIKKHFRDGKLDLDALKKELGDVVYYWARICRYFNFQPSEVLQANIDKLMSRRSRGTLQGDGDNR